MDIELLIYCITAIVSALGLKEVWSICKKKIDFKNKKIILDEKTKDQITSQVIEELKSKIGELEEKIDDLIEKNKQCAIKLARLEERIMLSAKKSATRKRTKASTTKEK